MLVFMCNVMFKRIANGRGYKLYVGAPGGLSRTRERFYMFLNIKGNTYILFQAPYPAVYFDALAIHPTDFMESNLL